MFSGEVPCEMVVPGKRLLTVLAKESIRVQSHLLGLWSVIAYVVPFQVPYFLVAFEAELADVRFVRLGLPLPAKSLKLARATFRYDEVQATM